MSTTEEVSAYELLELTVEATEKDIRTAYRQRSLKVHPDRNPNNPDAARKFHELNQAYELLLDPLRRIVLDAKIRLQQAKKERYKNYDAKRKTMMDELDQREQAHKKARTEKQKEEVEKFHETERIKEEGRKLREEKQKELKKMEEERLRAMAPREEEEDMPPPLDHLDTTVRLKYSLKTHPNLITTESIAALLSSFGATDTDSIVLSLKAPKKNADKPPKFGTALVPFKQIGDAFAAVCASGRAERGLHGVEIKWVGGKEPQILGWLKKMGKLSTPTALSRSTSAAGNEGSNVKAKLPQMQSTGDASLFSSFPSTFPDILPPRPSPTISTAPAGIDFESLTLMRLRQAERERLEREILEQETNES
ncbi:DnaJ-domain-containing protein [Crucibulum laeve]|uniref:DnaJ-domain-containing protein n=1 Tax=Crucibulum laeve TaxID=68775 RepID=A0A5C3LR09_9AGAR|nr:DnaJ-domain-containing protein [Crucibulum laeve]